MEIKSSLRVRNLTIDDYNKKYLDLLEQLTIVNKESITTSIFDNFVENLNDNHQVFIIEDNCKIIATITVLIESKLIRSAGKVAHIEDVVVDKDYYGMQIGRKLINHCVDYAKTRGCYKVILDCSEDVKQFYEKCGFIDKGFMMAVYL